MQIRLSICNTFKIAYYLIIRRITNIVTINSIVLLNSLLKWRLRKTRTYPHVQTFCAPLCQKHIHTLLHTHTHTFNVHTSLTHIHIHSMCLPITSTEYGCLVVTVIWKTVLWDIWAWSRHFLVCFLLYAQWRERLNLALPLNIKAFIAMEYGWQSLLIEGLQGVYKVLKSVKMGKVLESA